MKFTRKATQGILIFLLLICGVVSIAACSFTTKEVTSISVVYDQGDAVIYEGTPLDELKSSLTVTLHYGDGSSKATDDYTLSGSLGVGSSVVTVTSHGFEKTFTVNVSEAPDTSHTHTLVKHEASAPTCSENGNVEYWICSTCNKSYSDAEATTELSDVVIPAAHVGEIEIRGYKAAGEYTDGYSGDSYCLTCGELVSLGSVIEHTSTSPAVIVSSAVLDGDTLTVVISLVNNPGIASMKFAVVYADSLTVEAVEFSDKLGAYATSPEPYINPQQFNWISTDDLTDDGEFVTVTFKLDSGVTVGDTLEIRIILDNENIFDSQMSAVQFDAVGTTVTVNE